VAKANVMVELRDANNMCRDAAGDARHVGSHGVGSQAEGAMVAQVRIGVSDM
jgi:hypothetical protein